MKRMPYTRFQQLCSALAIVTLVLILGFTVWRYPSLPDQIPSHFNIHGEIDGWSGKGFIWFMPIVAVLLYLTVAVATHFPSIWNLPFAINDRNRAYAYRQCKNMLCVMNLAMLLLFAFIHWHTVEGQTLSGWFFAGEIALFILGPIIWSIYIWRRAKTI